MASTTSNTLAAPKHQELMLHVFVKC